MDVVEKLRNRATNWSEPNGADSILDLEAAEEIVRLRKGIREIAEYPQGLVYSAGYAPDDAEAMVEIAKQALIGR